MDHRKVNHKVSSDGHFITDTLKTVRDEEFASKVMHILDYNQYVDRPADIKNRLNSIVEGLNAVESGS